MRGGGSHLGKGHLPKSEQIAHRRNKGGEEMNPAAGMEKEFDMK
jgi:hypothetical protein